MDSSSTQESYTPCFKGVPFGRCSLSFSNCSTSPSATGNCQHLPVFEIYNKRKGQQPSDLLSEGEIRKAPGEIRKAPVGVRRHTLPRLRTWGTS